MSSVVHHTNRAWSRLQPYNHHSTCKLPAAAARPSSHTLGSRGRERTCVTTAAAPAPKVVVPRTAARSRVLFVGGLPASTDAHTLQQQLASACDAAGFQATRVQVMPFEDEAQRTRFAADWLHLLQHKGYALLAFGSEASLTGAAASIAARAGGWGLAADTLTIGPARTVPDGWPPELTYTKEELAALQEQQQDLDERRAHNRRQRQRQSKRLVAAVEQLLAGLSSPFGSAVWQLYQPVIGSQAQEQLTSLAASHTLDTQTEAVSPGPAVCMPPRLQQALRWQSLFKLLHQEPWQQLPGSSSSSSSQGPVQLAAAPTAAGVEQHLLLDWSQIPAVLDPAFGGQLADGDVVKAGAGRLNLRALRKRVQVESFALVLWQLLGAGTNHDHATCARNNECSHSSQPPPPHIVEFGCGSGNLVLPLAYLFPHCTFFAVDMKPSAVQLLQARVLQAGLSNISVQLGRIEDYAGPADVVLALHACGSATDWSLEQAARCNAAFLVSPCCIGKINRRSGTGSGGDSSSGSSTLPPLKEQQQHGRLRVWQPLQYPRSALLQQQMGDMVWQVQQQQQQALDERHAEADMHDVGSNHADATRQQQQRLLALGPLLEAIQSGSPSLQGQSRGLFSILAATADYSHQDYHSHPQVAALAKSNVELDRGMVMVEAGYRVALTRLLQPELTAKADVLVGIPTRGPAESGSAGAPKMAWQWADVPW